MDDYVRQRLINYALSIEQFRSLHQKDKEWLYPLLSKGFKSTISMLDLIADRELTYEEIGLEMGLSPQTICQKLNCLLQGGMSLSLTKTTAIAHTGRPRKLVAHSRRI